MPELIIGTVVGPQGPQGLPGPPGASPTIDDTLSNTGQAADAKATGDRFATLETIITGIEEQLANVGGAAAETPYVFDLDAGYVADGAWTPGGTSVTYSDVYTVTSGRPYLIALGTTTGTRFRAMFSTVDTSTASTSVTGTKIINQNNPAAYAGVLYTPSANGYVTISKDNTGVPNIKTYVFDVTKITS